MSLPTSIYPQCRSHARRKDLRAAGDRGGPTAAPETIDAETARHLTAAILPRAHLAPDLLLSLLPAVRRS
ncbi:MAG: hypothetical protein Udaeo2_12740 [Candidatus Udaeobacter sp.]|nr:MAG: hypothetical protein Udaeo2_12740 [Candidatus Udaeobacter sp.]